MTKEELRKKYPIGSKHICYWTDWGDVKIGEIFTVTLLKSDGTPKLFDKNGMWCSFGDIDNYDKTFKPLTQKSGYAKWFTTYCEKKL